MHLHPGECGDRSLQSVAKSSSTVYSLARNAARVHLSTATSRRLVSAVGVSHLSPLAAARSLKVCAPSTGADGACDRQGLACLTAAL